MSSALWAGVSGLNASSKALDVISNNLANLNTVGFKAGTTYFADVLSQSVSGGAGGSMQVGRGVSVAEVQTQFDTGSFETTGNAMDVAIDGDGFYIVNDATDATYYSRAGSFHLNSDGVMVDTNGYAVQGKMITNGIVSGTLSDIVLKDYQSKPSATTTISMGSNLSSTTATGGQYKTTQTVYDSLGNSHGLNTTFTKTGNVTSGYWGVEVALDSTAATGISRNGLIFDTDGNMSGTYTGAMGAVTATSVGGGTATGVLNRPGMVYQTGTMTLTRGATPATWTVTGAGGYTNASVVSADATTVRISLEGTDTPDVTLTLAGVWANGDTAQYTLTHSPTLGLNDIDIDFSGLTLNSGATIGNAGHVNWDLAGANALSITQYASASVIRSLSADGYASGQLKSLSIDSDGMISGSFTNGQISELAQLVLAKFTNPWGLSKLGSNLFGQTITSGAAIQDNPNNSGLGSLTPNSLEMSNTDVATEFIKMITAQKAYQANAKVVTTEDTIMQVLMGLKQ
ncbi:MAG: flagellar hook protein FlgE [Syntrophaceae bacterium]|nr:flagellar hook protein FlgE [Syntrophaceae bacterium]